MYLVGAMRPDISFVVSKLNRFTRNPRDDNWCWLECVMDYLVVTMDYLIHYSSYPVVLEGYSDAIWISNVNELFATSGYVFTLGGVASSWR
jgi:hypothetical protein